jgi:hypothetical protein
MVEGLWAWLQHAVPDLRCGKSFCKVSMGYSLFLQHVCEGNAICRERRRRMEGVAWVFINLTKTTPFLKVLHYFIITN